jgi:hypothetical protein
MRRTNGSHAETGSIFLISIFGGMTSETVIHCETQKTEMETWMQI